MKDRRHFRRACGPAAKRLIAVILTIMMVLALAGCGQNDTGAGEPAQGESGQSEASAWIGEKDETSGSDATAFAWGEDMTSQWKAFLFDNCGLMYNDMYTVDRYAIGDFDEDGNQDLMIFYRDNFEACFWHIAVCSFVNEDGTDCDRIIDKLIFDQYDSSEYQFWSTGIVIKNHWDPENRVQFTTVYDMMGWSYGDLAQGPNDYVRYEIYEGDVVDTGTRLRIKEVPVEGLEPQLKEQIYEETDISSPQYFDELNEYTYRAHEFYPDFVVVN